MYVFLHCLTSKPITKLFKVLCTPYSIIKSLLKMKLTLRLVFFFCAQFCNQENTKFLCAPYLLGNFIITTYTLIGFYCNKFLRHNVISAVTFHAKIPITCFTDVNDIKLNSH